MSRGTDLVTTDGRRLPADLVVPEGATTALVVAHPHPLYGGDRHNPVVAAVVRAAEARGAATIRFDFRGVDSPAAHDEGDAERADVMAALDALGAAAPEAKLVLAGYSFGAGVSLSVIDPRVAGWVAIAPVLGTAPAGSDPRPKLLLVAEHDQFCPPARAHAAVDGWAATTLEVVGSADHFLAGHARQVGERAVEFALTV